jgi:hypothetical protein
MPDARAMESFSGYLKSMGGFFEYLVSPIVSYEEALTAFLAVLKLRCFNVYSNRSDDNVVETA